MNTSRPVCMEEYKHCSCTQMEYDSDDLLGYCRRHGNDRRYFIILPAGVIPESDLGFLET